MLNIGSKEVASLYCYDKEVNHLDLANNEVYSSNIPEYLKAFKKVSTITKDLVNSLNMQDVEDVTIPKNVTTIDTAAFQNLDKMKSVTISNSVTSIGDSAFSGCAGLINVIIPESVESIGKSAFRDCNSLTNIVILSTKYNTIKEYTFYNCSNLTNIDVSRLSYLEIDKYAFSHCTNLSTFEWRSSLDRGSISSYAFENCLSLTSIHVPRYLYSIANTAFYGCDNLEHITVDVNNNNYYCPDGCNAIIFRSQKQLVLGCKNTIIPDDVQFIQKYAFAGCKGLINITIPDSVVGIKEYAFSNCSGLKSITIPKSVTGLGSYGGVGGTVFIGCNALTSIKVDADNTQFDSRDNCNAIIQISNNRLIVGCKNTIIPNSVTAIGGLSFSGQSELTSITIPNSVTIIVSTAFKDCIGLTNVTVENEFNSSLYISAGSYTPEVMINIFNNLKDLTGETSKTISLGIDNLAKLTEEQKAIATNKNWKLV